MPARSDKLPMLRPVDAAQPDARRSPSASPATSSAASSRRARGCRPSSSMVAAMGVSRTTVREAVAALRADGLVVTRQGAGAFVAPDAPRRPFRLAVDGLPSVAEVIDVMELRARVEVEAAGLAAARATAVRRAGAWHARSPLSTPRSAAERRDRRGFPVPSDDRKGNGKCAVRAFPRISRPLHHSAADDPRGRASCAGAARVSGAVPDRASRNSAAIAAGRRCGCARSHAAASGNSQERYRRLVAEVGMQSLGEQVS